MTTVGPKLNTTVPLVYDADDRGQAPTSGGSGTLRSARKVERDFAQADSLSVEYGELHIDGTDGVAWFATKATVRASVGGEPFESALRLTGVVTRQGDGWKIVQSHLSFPAEAQEPGSSF